MIAFPNAKINIGLFVTEKRTDGFHNIESILYPIPFYDILEIIKSDTTKTNLEISGNKIDESNEDNLVLKAYYLLKKDFDLPPVNIYLHKVIPSGAGLGGGSSDAAFTLKLLNTLFDLKLNDTRLQEYGASLGSDCGFFIKNKTILAFGKGNQFKNINLDLNNKYIVIIKPSFSVNTKNAYSIITPQKRNSNFDLTIGQSFEKWQKYLTNDFEKPIFLQHPEIKKLKTTLINKGAFYASMSGSGSAVFGLFHKKPTFKNEIDTDNYYYQKKLF